MAPLVATLREKAEISVRFLAKQEVIIEQAQQKEINNEQRYTAPTKRGTFTEMKNALSLLAGITQLVILFAMLGGLFEGFAGVFHGFRWMFGEKTIAIVGEASHHTWKDTVKLPARLGGQKVPHQSSIHKYSYSYSVDGLSYEGVSDRYLGEKGQEVQVRYDKLHPEQSGFAYMAVRDGIERSVGWLIVGPLLYIVIGIVVYFPCSFFVREDFWDFWMFGFKPRKPSWLVRAVTRPL